MTDEHSNDQIDDLDDLDSLLDELDNDVLSKPPGSGLTPETEKTILNDTLPKETGSVEDDFSSMMKEIQQQDPNLASQLNAFVTELQKDENDDGDVSQQQQLSKEPKNFEDIVSETINRLKTSGKDVDKQIEDEQSGDPISQLLKQLGDMNMEGGDGADAEDGEEGGFGDILMDMLSQLTSKNVLYEPLKDLHVKFPPWLQQNKDKIGVKEYENYENQYKIVDEIILKFEDPNYHEKIDSEFINLKLENLQDLGMPPEDIMNSELSGIPGFNGANTEFNNDEIPKDIEKQLEENCKQT